jgi:sigma-E factor negative regulatory protein RseC
MNEAGALVVRVEGDQAWVRLEPQGGSCGACRQRSGCGLAAGFDTAATDGELLRLPNAIHARAGDRVVVCAAAGEVLRAAWRAYGVPLLLGMLAAAGGMALTGSDVGAGLGMLGGLVAGVLLMRRRQLDFHGGKPILTLRFKNMT